MAAKVDRRSRESWQEERKTLNGEPGRPARSTAETTRPAAPTTPRKASALDPPQKTAVQATPLPRANPVRRALRSLKLTTLPTGHSHCLCIKTNGHSKQAMPNSPTPSSPQSALKDQIAELISTAIVRLAQQWPTPRCGTGKPSYAIEDAAVAAGFERIKNRNVRARLEKT